MAKILGYIRVSTSDQTLDLQLDELIKAGCDSDNIYKDKISGVKSERPGLEKCLSLLESGDTLIVWRLDRLGRSMRHLINLIEEFKNKGIRFKSLSEGLIDTSSAAGELIFNLFSILAQFERRLIQERTNAGLAAARARGRVGGRKPILITDPKVIAAKKMHENKFLPIPDICKTLNISKSTLYKYLNLVKK